MQIVCQVHEQPRTGQLRQVDGKLFIYISSFSPEKVVTHSIKDVTFDTPSVWPSALTSLTHLPGEEDRRLIVGHCTVVVMNSRAAVTPRESGN